MMLMYTRPTSSGAKWYILANRKGDRDEEAEEGGELAGDIEADQSHDGVSEEHVNRPEQGGRDEQLHLGPDRRGRGQGYLELLCPPAP